jgi:signal transduction histidine kinase
MPFPALLVATFSVALHVRSTVLAVAGGITPAVLLAAVVGTEYWSGEPTATDIAVLVFFVGGAWSAGRLLRQRALEAASAEAAGGEAAREAVRAERTRMARELHDIVAHAISLTVIQAGAAEELLERDPVAARQHLHLVRQAAREALDEMRRMLQVLEPEDAVYAPQPGLARVADLVETARASGLPVALVEEGEPTDVPAGVDLAAFRIVQEALTNVRKHAGAAPTRVTIRYNAGTVEVEVLNEAGSGGLENPRGGGRGLVGMRERVRIYGGSVDAGPDRNGGFAVRATLPLHQESRL